MQGGILRNQDGVNEDLISELPEALILKIFYFLPTKNVIATSVLSKQWRSLWKMVPRLEFKCGGMNTEEFSENVTSFLLSHKAQVLESFHLKKMSCCDAKDVKLWVGIALALRVRKLALGGTFPSRFTFPNNLFSSKTLETLKLNDLPRKGVPSSICMKSLRTLHLTGLGFYDNESFCNLISGCPILENLFLCNLEIGNIYIVAPSLKRLSIYTNIRGGYMINAPSLKYFKINGWNLNYSFIENAPMLDEAHIYHLGAIDVEKIWGSLMSTKRLSFILSPLHVTFQMKYPTSTIFYQLLYLEINTNRKEWWNLLTFMLECSPKLQALKLIDPFSVYEHSESKHNIGEGKLVPECLLSHLETFVWNSYHWKIEDEKKVATYILKNARQLKKAIFSITLENLEERDEMLKELDGVVGARDSCQLVFKESNSNDPIHYKNSGS